MIFFLYGPDTFRSQEKLRALVENFKQKRDWRGLSVLRLEGQDLTVDKFRQSVFSPGLFSTKRLIIIENLLSQNEDSALLQEVINFVRKSKKGKKKEEKDNVVIFRESEEKIPQNESHQKLFSLLKKEKYAQKFDWLENNELRKWIKEEVKKRDGEIEEKAVDLLVNFIGPDLWRMSTELDKLIAYGQGKISAKNVKLIVETKPEEDIFNLIDALVEKNKKRAVQLIREQLENDIPFTQLLNLLARQFRIILQIKDRKEKFLNYYQLASELGVHPYSVKKSLIQAPRYTLDELKKIYQELLRIDYQLKTTNLQPELLFDLLVAKL
ncbi:MAG: DNA polymerase III subunit delta [Patescibacteria group bacterium]|nr:DNA polymerase III subunit delta [Patescibacteria group bacterium]